MAEFNRLVIQAESDEVSANLAFVSCFGEATIDTRRKEVSILCNSCRFDILAFQVSVFEVEGERLSGERHCKGSQWLGCQ